MKNLNEIISLCKRRGFIFQSSEIYGGINGFWDYGPLGCELKRNIKELWWKDIVIKRDDVVGLDCSIIMHPKVWEASGHVSNFTDPMCDCRSCKHRFKADQLCEDQGKLLIKKENGEYQLPEDIQCPVCGAKDFTHPRSFNLMFKTFVGPVEDDSSITYLRPETAQGIFVQFDNTINVSRMKIPFGIAQIGKAFRNEINPRNFTFRSREFEQMELEYFIKPGTDEEYHTYWVNERLKWYQKIGFKKENLTKHIYKKDELAHYAKACTDIMYEFPFGTQELEGIAARGDFDLKMHSQFSGKPLLYFDQETGEKYIPHVIEPSAGVDRIILAIICEAFCKEWVKTSVKNTTEKTPAVLSVEENPKPPEGYEERIVLKFKPCVAPIKAGVFPLLKNKDELVNKSKEIYKMLKPFWNVIWDITGSIGKRYRRQDEIGTPFCITVDFQTLEDNTVTIRDRDTTEQERISIDNLLETLNKKINE